jgi:CheY-like chemotaxis protein
MAADGGVLIVDDDEDLRGMVEMVLNLEGYRVRAAGDGAEALAEVEREMPAVILLDMRMPVMDGWTFATRFRARYGPAAPIVVLTAAADARQRAQDIGAEDFLAKPFSLPALLWIVDRNLKTRAQPAQR